MKTYIVFHIILAFMLDLMIGDPAWSIHPVRLIGRLIESLERYLKKPDFSAAKNKIFGVLLVLLVCLTVFFSTYLLVTLAMTVHPLLGIAVSVILICSSFAVKDLKRSAENIAAAVGGGRLDDARLYASQIVGRDTHDLSQEQIIRASIESVAESTVDGIIAPIFYAFIGGAPLAMLYRATNTMDSMIGYKNSKYVDFGWAAARFDDVLNFVPARINAVLVPLACFALRKNSRESLAAIIRDGKRHPSPNSGIAEAAFAGALGVQLGGESTYDGVPHFKPYLGSAGTLLDVSHIRGAIHLSIVCATTMIALGSLVLLTAQ